MGFGDKKEAWEESVNMTPDELGTVRPGAIMLDKSDELYPLIKEQFTYPGQVKQHISVLQDSPVRHPRTGVRHARWLYCKTFTSSGIEGVYIYDNGDGTYESNG